MNILIVENSPRVRRTIRSLIAGLAHEVFECGDGRQALAAYQTHRPDWVLMDIGLKEVDGIVVTGKLKAAFPEAKVVIVTDYDDAGLRLAAQQAGACAMSLKRACSNCASSSMPRLTKRRWSKFGIPSAQPT